MARRFNAIVEMLEARQMLAVFANGLDSENMGKGAWGWDLRNAMIQQGFTYTSANYTPFFNHLKNDLGLTYFITKAADADDVFINGGGVQNYTTAVKAAAQAAGVKILPYFYIYGGAKAGSTLQGEIDIFKQFMDTNLSGGGTNPNYVGGDGAVLDIEGEYAGATGGAVAAITNYAIGIGKSQSGNGSGVRDGFFVSYSTFPYVSLHSEVPYLQLGDYFDAAMPQAYWATLVNSPTNSACRSPTKGQPLTGVGGPTRMVTDVNSEYGQRSLESTPRNNIWFGQPNSIKPIILTGQSYGTATSSEITEFITAAKNSTTVPKTGAAGAVYSHGYRSIDFFDLNSTDSGEQSAIGAQTVGVVPGTPSSPSPANNATNVIAGGLVLDWADVLDATTTGAATSYDVYFDGSFKTNTTTSSWTVSPAISGGTHNWQIVARDLHGTTSSPLWSFNATAVLPGVPSSPSPANNAVITVQPTKLDWADASNATSYDVYIGTNPTPVNTTISELNISPADGVRLWRVTAINPNGSTAGPQWQYTLDRVAPSATYGAQTPSNGAAFLDFTVTYADTTTGVDISTLDNLDITVTGPNSYSAAATLVSVDTLSNGSPRIATYRIPGPGGTWDPADNGSYTVSQNATQVKDVAGNYRAAGTIGSFSSNIANFAHMSGSVLIVDMDGSAAIQLTPSGADILAIKSGQTLSFSGATSVSVNGTAGSDTLDYSGTIAAPIQYSSGAGADVLNVLGGTYTFGSNASAGSTALTINVSGSGTVQFNASQTLAALNLSGTAEAVLAGDGNRFLHVGAGGLVVGASAGLDMSDNDLIVEYGTGPNAFADVKGQVIGGFGGTTGIYSSTSDGSQILALFDNGLVGVTDWNGEPVGANCVIGKYTYFGDVNFDGQVTGDDYTIVDSNLNTTPPEGFEWLSGDANLDGIVTGDDYTTIDSNLGLGSGNPLSPMSFSSTPIASQAAHRSLAEEMGL